MRLTVPRRGGWRAWGAVRADFERALADPADPAVASAEIASELRRGADYVRVALALTVLTTDVADALTIAWDAFRGAARDDLTGWEVAAAAAEVQPEPPLTAPAVAVSGARGCGLRAGCQGAGDEVALRNTPEACSDVSPGNYTAWLPGVRACYLSHVTTRGKRDAEHRMPERSAGIGISVSIGRGTQSGLICIGYPSTATLKSIPRSPTARRASGLF